MYAAHIYNMSIYFCVSTKVGPWKNNNYRLNRSDKSMMHLSTVHLRQLYTFEK